MGQLRVLITNHGLDQRAGTELYVRELAAGLLRRGHSPVAYSTRLGAVARELRAATVPVIDDLDSLSATPDIIHGQHHVETMTALLRFPHTPAVFFCHGWLPWQEAPPVHPRILRYVAVDDTCRDRLVCEHGVPESRLRVILNSVDLERFRPRGPLPLRPRRALVFSNSARETNYVGEVRAACERAGLALDVLGLHAGNGTGEPEKILGAYDLVFAKARCALEAMAVGAAVVLCDKAGAGPLVTSTELERLRRLNFGVRTLDRPVAAEALAREIERYDAADASEVSRRVRAEAGQESAFDEIAALYGEVLEEYASAGRRDEEAEGRAAARYLRGLGLHMERAEDEVNNSATFRLRRRLLGLPLVGRLARTLARRS